MMFKLLPFIVIPVIFTGCFYSKEDLSNANTEPDSTINIIYQDVKGSSGTIKDLLNGRTAKFSLNTKEQLRVNSTFYNLVVERDVQDGRTCTLYNGFKYYSASGDVNLICIDTQDITEPQGDFNFAVGLNFSLPKSYVIPSSDVNFQGASWEFGNNLSTSIFIEVLPKEVDPESAVLTSDFHTVISKTSIVRSATSTSYLVPGSDVYTVGSIKTESKVQTLQLENMLMVEINKTFGIDSKESLSFSSSNSKKTYSEFDFILSVTNFNEVNSTKVVSTSMLFTLIPKNFKYGENTEKNDFNEWNEISNPNRFSLSPKK